MSGPPLGRSGDVTHEIVSGHDGRVEVESDAENGTRFRVFLPRRGTPKDADEG